jgi:two-component system sensor histidine kinase and response regulator WspE
VSGDANLGGFSMFELFKVEAETNCAALNEGLLAVESSPDDLARIEPIMRAAHSVKGAARIIGLDLVVRLAHAMEDRLVAAQKGEERLTPERIDQLLSGVDLLQQVSALDESEIDAWTERSTGAVDALVAKLEAPVADTKPEPAPPPDDDASPAPPRDERPPAVPAPSAPAETAFVRVGADRLDRLMQLAGESVVEARRMQSFRSSMERIRDGQRRLDDVLQQADVRRDDNGDLLAEIREAVQTARDRIRAHDEELESALRRSELLSSSLYDEVLGSRMRPFSDGTAGFPRMVRDLARDLGKKVRFEIRGDAVPVDRDVLARLEAPVNHMLRNCVDHGIETPEARRAAGKPETGHVVLEARHHAGMLTVELRDDGGGIDADAVRRRAVERGLVAPSLAEALGHDEVLEFLFLPGFSTASAVTEVSGRGVGLDVVQSMVHEISGAVRVASEPGASTTFTLRLPITLSVVRAAIVEIAGEPYAFALTQLARILQLASADVTPVEGRQQFTLDGRSVGLAPAAEILDLGQPEPASASIRVLVLGEGDRQCGVVVDRFMGEQDLVVRTLDARLGKVPHISSAAVLANGDPVLIVDGEDLLQSMQQLVQEGRLRRMAAPDAGEAEADRDRILVVDDSITVREVERQLLMRHGYAVDVAVDGQDGWNALQSGRYDLLVTDVDMPRMNGFELIRRVRQDPRLTRLPIIIVSYKDRKEDRVKGMELGANAYLTKHSFHDDSFLTMVSDLIGQAE